MSGGRDHVIDPGAYEERCATLSRCLLDLSETLAARGQRLRRVAVEGHFPRAKLVVEWHEPDAAASVRREEFDLWERPAVPAGTDYRASPLRVAAYVRGRVEEIASGTTVASDRGVSAALLAAEALSGCRSAMLPLDDVDSLHPVAYEAKCIAQTRALLETSTVLPARGRELKDVRIEDEYPATQVVVEWAEGSRIRTLTWDLWREPVLAYPYGYRASAERASLLAATDVEEEK